MRRGFEGLMVGRTLAGRYEVIDAIARGGMSVVYRGLDRTLGREVGVKVVSLAASSDTALANFRERFRREAASAARIQHPNVVQIFDYGTDPELELDFIVMELMRGRDLKEALRERALTHPEALRILADAARGVAAGHRAGIVHRDVKPANVFLVGDADGVIDGVKILDFGIAKPLEDDPEHALTTIGSLPHSPAYASPEQLDMHRPVTAASDVYQLGLIGYEMLAGQRPYDEGDRAAVRGGEDVPLPTPDAWLSVPAHVREVIQRALRPRPGDRYPDAAAFVEALTTAQAEDATAFHAMPAPVVADADTTQMLEGAEDVRVISPSVGEVAPAAAPPVVSEPAAPPPAAVPVAPPVGVPVPPPSTRRSGFPRGPVLWIVPLLLLLAIGVWAATRGGDDPGTVATADSTAAMPDSGSVAALDEEFLRLEGVAGRAAGTQPSPAIVPGGTTPPVTPPAGAQPLPQTPATQQPPPATPAAVMAQAETEIRAAVEDLNKAWVDGDISRHVSHYGSRVDYYNSNNLPRSGVRRDRTRDLRRYDDRRIGLRSMQVQWQAPDRARVLVDKEWIFGGDGRTRQGRGMQEYIFKRDEDDGKWYVVSEQLLTTSEARSNADQ
jgi:eukaryotic-like serine/threonine-protein kinase